ncbi:MAG: GNAT family N-acetyltransferase [Gallionella sp.]|nr:GNAT family N-acetyltransferase [Gallionella sp.]
MSIHIESANTDDVNALVELLNVLFSIEQDFTPDETSQRIGLQLLLNSQDQGRIFVARHPQAGVVGMVSAQLVISTAMGAPSAWIEDMVIRDEFRGQGLGKLLLEKAAEWAKSKGAKRIQLVADSDNAPALGFYKNLGWEPTRLCAWKKILC